MRCGFSFLFVSALLSSPVAAQAGPVKWLKSRAQPFAASGAEGDDFADLMPLRERFSGLRCVALGEAQHGDGSSFVAKTRLVRFLHEKCGFDVLVMESGLWDCAQAWAAMQKGGNAVENAERGVFGVWTKSLQCAALWAYVQESAASDSPLELAGFDCQLTGKAAASLPRELARRAAAIAKIDEAEVARELAAIVEALSDEKAQLAKGFDKSLDKLGRAVGRAKKSAERAFLAQCVKSLQGAIDARRARTARDSKARFNPRDEAMGSNLLYLVNERYAGRKLIVWAATMHVLRRAPGIENPRMKNYSGIRPMGSYVAKELREDYYVVGVSSYEGETGFPWHSPRRIASAASGSFESYAREAELSCALVDMRGAKGDHPFARKILARPLGHVAMRAKWPEHLDAMLYIDTMRPSRMLQDREANLELRDPVEAFAAELKQVAARFAAGNPYSEKGDVCAPWSNWVDLAAPGREAMRTAAERFENWAAQSEVPDGVAWRVARMRAAIAQSLGDAAAATRAFDAAIDGYPRREYSQPSRMSGFQHLVNDAGGHALRSEGLSAAIARITPLLASDARYAHFFAQPWTTRLDDKQKRRFQGALLRALEKRLENFPGQAAGIRQQMAALRRFR